MRFESEIFAKGTREGGEKTHTPKKKTQKFFSENNVENQPSMVSKSTRFCCHPLNRPTTREMQWRMPQSLKQLVVLKFELMLVFLVKPRNIGGEKLLRICFNKDKIAIFLCVFF